MQNLLSGANSRFDAGLLYWTGTASHKNDDGYPRNGCAVVADTQSLISVAVSLVADEPHTLHLFAKIDSGATVTVAAGPQQIGELTGALAPPMWIEYVVPFAPTTAVVGSITFDVAGGDALIDTVTVGASILPATRRGIAATVEQHLSALAVDAGLTMDPSIAGPEGDYTAAIDDGLRSLGSVDRYGFPDITLLDFDQVSGLIDATQGAMLQILRADYALETDVTLGPRTERRSQIAANLDGMIGGGAGGSGARVQVRKMSREAGWRR